MDYLISPSQTRHSSRQDINFNISESAQSAQPWTATRCHRLLRPLLTHIGALRRENKLRSARLGASEDVTTATKRRRKDTDSSCYYPEKKVCRKYTTKGSRRASNTETTTPQKPTQAQRRRVLSQKPASSRQEVVLPTPFLRRVKNHPLSSSPNRGPKDGQLPTDAPTTTTAAPSTRCSHPKTCTKGKCSFEVELASLRASLGPGRHGIYEPIFRALESLLKATSASKYPAPAAPRSFLAMCLRKIPDYVAELEYWDQKDAKEEGTKSTNQISFEIYSELEGLNGVSGGWRHLCLVVRAHGVRVIREAILEDQLLDDPFTDLLIRLCLEYMPVSECMGLIDGFIQRPYPRPFAAEDSLFTTPGLRPLRILKKCEAQDTGASILPTKLAELLSRGFLPGKWILTKEFKALWASTAGLIVEKRYRQDVIDFTITTVAQMCSLVSNSERLAGRMKDNEQPWDKAQNTLTGVIAALTSITLLMQEGASSPRRIEMATKRIKFVVDSCSRDQNPTHIGTYLLSLCTFLAFKTDSALQESWRRVQHSRGSEEWTRKYDATTVFISSVAYYCSRGAHSTPAESFGRLCDALETPQLPGGPFRNLRVDGAFILADQTGDLRDLAYAESLKPAGARAVETKETRGGQDETSFVGFRWDEGISEWVNISPVAGRPCRQFTGGSRVCETDRPVRARETRNKAPVYQLSGDEDEEEGEDDGQGSVGTSEETGDGLSISDDGDVRNLDDAGAEEAEEDVEVEVDEDEEDEEETPNTQPVPSNPAPDPKQDQQPPPLSDEYKSETPLPTLANLFSSNRLRRPRKSLPLQLPSSPPLSSSPPAPRRRSIWHVSTPAATADDELCFDSPSRKKMGDTYPRGNTSLNNKARRKSAGESLLCLQPRRGRTSTATTATTTALEGFRKSTGSMGGRAFMGRGDGSEVDELSFC